MNVDRTDFLNISDPVQLASQWNAEYLFWHWAELVTSLWLLCEWCRKVKAHLCLIYRALAFWSEMWDQEIKRIVQKQWEPVIERSSWRRGAGPCREIMCGEVASPSVVELCDLSFTLSLRVRPEQGEERTHCAPWQPGVYRGTLAWTYSRTDWNKWETRERGKGWVPGTDGRTHVQDCPEMLFLGYIWTWPPCQINACVLACTWCLYQGCPPMGVQWFPTFLTLTWVYAADILPWRAAEERIEQECVLGL